MANLSKSKKTKYLDFYNNCMVTGRIPEDGLCRCFNDAKSKGLLDLLVPENNFERKYGYWGWDGEWSLGDAIDIQTIIHRAFNPFRQNIVLFMAAMNREL